MPFDRMVLAVYEWFTELPPRQRNWQVVAQVGQTALTLPEVNGWKTHAVLAEHDFHTYCRQADLMVGHAGMGLVLTALDFARPMLLMPRQGQKRETRNNHQLSTARWLQNQKGVLVAWDEKELKQLLNDCTIKKQTSILIGAHEGFLIKDHQKNQTLVVYLQSFLDGHKRLAL